MLNIDYSISVVNNFPLHFPVSRDSQMREIATMRARVVELESEADRLRRQLTNEKFERSVKTRVYYCSSSCFTVVGVKLDTLLYGYFFPNDLCCSFLSTFPPPLPFSDLSPHSPPILAVVFSFSATFLLLCLGSFR